MGRHAKALVAFTSSMAPLIWSQGNEELAAARTSQAGTQLRALGKLLLDKAAVI